MSKVNTIWVAVILVMLISIMAGGCSNSETTTYPTPGTNTNLVPGTYEEGPSFDPAKSVATKSFSSIDEYNEFVKKYQSGGNYYYGDLGGGSGFMLTSRVAQDIDLDGGRNE